MHARGATRHADLPRAGRTRGQGAVRVDQLIEAMNSSASFEMAACSVTSMTGMTSMSNQVPKMAMSCTMALMSSVVTTANPPLASARPRNCSNVTFSDGAHLLNTCRERAASASPMFGFATQEMTYFMLASLEEIDCLVKRANVESPKPCTMDFGGKFSLTMTLRRFRPTAIGAKRPYLGHQAFPVRTGRGAVRLSTACPRQGERGSARRWP